LIRYARASSNYSDFLKRHLHLRNRLLDQGYEKISQQPENCENRNDPDLVQAFLKKWWVESNFKAPNLLLSLRFKGSAVTITVFKYRNKILKKFIFQYQDLVEIYSVSAETIISDAFSYSENV
jgi:hypothetical protein